MFILTRQFDKLGFVGELGIDSLRRGRVSRPPEFRDLYGAERETRPLRCFYGWPAKFPIYQFMLSRSAPVHPLFQGGGAEGRIDSLLGFHGNGARGKARQGGVF